MRKAIAVIAETVTVFALGMSFWAVLQINAKQSKPKTCECIEVSGCDCVKGFCKCGEYGKTCEACYEHAKRQAERAKR